LNRKAGKSYNEKTGGILLEAQLADVPSPVSLKMNNL
jgi:hypothetical protein